MNRKMPRLQINKLRILRFMVPMRAKNESGLSMKLVAQPSRLRVAAASRRQHEHRAGRPMHSQARTPGEDACATSAGRFIVPMHAEKTKEGSP